MMNVCTGHLHRKQARALMLTTVDVPGHDIHQRPVATAKLHRRAYEPIQRISACLRGTGGAGALGWPMAIGATGT